MWLGRHQALAMCSCSEKRNHGLSAKLLLTLLLTEKKVYNVLAKGQTRKWTF